MAAPTQGPYGTPVLDDFNRAGTTTPPSTSWTTGFNPTSGALALAGDTATVKANVAGFCDSYWNLASFGPDCEAWIVNSTLATGTDELFGLYLRGTPSANSTAYEFSLKANALTSVVVQRQNDASNFPTLATHTLPASFAAADGLAICVFGASFPLVESWWWDDSAGGGWQCIGRVVDTFTVAPVPASRTPFLGSGRIALELQNTTSRVDMVGGGTIVLPPVRRSLPPFQGLVPSGLSHPLGQIIPGSELTAAGGTTYTVAGSLTAGGLMSGADEWDAAEAGSLTAGALTSGADALTLSDAGSLTPFALVSAGDALLLTDTGSLTAGAIVSAADTFTGTDTGSLIAGALLSGADVFLPIETGALTTQAVLSGVGSKGSTYTVAGSLTSGALVSGPDALELADTGFLAAATWSSAVEANARSDAGSLAAGSSATGTDQLTASETGALTPGAQVSGFEGAAVAPPAAPQDDLNKYPILNRY